MKKKSQPTNTTNHELPVSDTQPRIGKWTEIGEVKITQTRFGKVKVQVITEQNDHHRNWIIALVLLLVLGVASWQAWQAWQQPEVTSNTESAIPNSINEAEKQPSTQPGKMTPAPMWNQTDSRPRPALLPEKASAPGDPKASVQQAQSLRTPEQDAANTANRTSLGQPAVKPDNAPHTATIVPGTSPVATPAVVPPEKPITPSTSPAGIVQPQVQPDTKQ